MKRTLYTLVLCSTLALGFTVGAAAQGARERHPVLERAIHQIDGIRQRLEAAPQDFGGHKQKAIDALKLATDELHAAVQYDKK